MVNELASDALVFENSIVSNASKRGRDILNRIYLKSKVCQILEPISPRNVLKYCELLLRTYARNTFMFVLKCSCELVHTVSNYKIVGFLCHLCSRKFYIITIVSCRKHVYCFNLTMGTL